MTTDTQWNNLIQEHEMAYFRGELATSSPESYSVDEMREISAALERKQEQRYRKGNPEGDFQYGDAADAVIGVGGPVVPELPAAHQSPTLW